MSETTSDNSIDKRIEGIEKKLDETTAAIARLSSIDTLDKRIESIEKKLDETTAVVLSLNNVIRQLAESSDMDVISKRIDDLQQYIVGLSQIEDKFQDLLNTFSETKEIVSIIVRQLDSLERKYNKTIADVSQLVEKMSKFTEIEVSTTTTPHTTRELPAKSPAEVPTHDEEEARVFQGPLPSSIDALMEKLLKVVTPQTEAATMARALEEIRDQLTTMIQGHTPVLFQFGKIARELKSYPPTATLNENDIARLNKEIRSWTTKLKEIARET